MRILCFLPIILLNIVSIDAMYRPSVVQLQSIAHLAQSRLCPAVAFNRCYATSNLTNTLPADTPRGELGARAFQVLAEARGVHQDILKCMIEVLYRYPSAVKRVTVNQVVDAHQQALAYKAQFKAYFVDVFDREGAVWLLNMPQCDLHSELGPKDYVCVMRDVTKIFKSITGIKRINLDRNESMNVSTMNVVDDALLQQMARDVLSKQK